MAGGVTALTPARGFCPLPRGACTDPAAGPGAQDTPSSPRSRARSCGAAAVRGRPCAQVQSRSSGPARLGARWGLSRRIRPRWRAAGLLLFVAVPLARAMVAGLMLPWFLGPGMVVRSNADLLAPLPVTLGASAPAGNSAVLAADGSVITYFYRHNRTPVPADAIADVMKQALVDIEDSRFYEHKGVDVEGTARALVRNLAAGTVQQGGSTITQQLVKQTLLQSATTPQQ